MLRVIKSVLSYANELFFYQGSPFTGVGFEPEDGKVVGHTFIDGRIGEIYKSEYFDESSMVHYIDSIDFFEEHGTDLFPLKCNGEPFSGVA